MFDYLHLIYTGTALTNKFKEYPLLYLVCAILYTVGAFADCLIEDRKNHTRRAARASLAGVAVLAIVSFSIYVYAQSFSEVSSEELFYLDKAIAFAWEEKELFTPFLWISLMYAALFVVGILLKNLFFLDLIVSLIPCGYVLILWNEKDLPVFGAEIAILSVATVLCRLMLTLFAKPTVAPKTVRQLISDFADQTKAFGKRACAIISPKKATALKSKK